MTSRVRISQYNKSKKIDIQFVVGIDEAGRGPLAGPVSVGAVVLPVRVVHPLFSVARDSKILSVKKRKEIFTQIRYAKKEGSLDYAVSLVSAKIIDEKGIVFAIRLAIKRILKKLHLPPHQTLVLLDGSLYAPEEFLYQKTIIRGDQTQSIISLASIVAKVTRDMKMIYYSKLYPDFDFDIHKGYGTRSHFQKIQKCGLSKIHRRSFLK